MDQHRHAPTLGSWLSSRPLRLVWSARARPSITGFTYSRWLGLGDSVTVTPLPALRPVGARGAVVVLHVAGAALGRGGVRRRASARPRTRRGSTRRGGRRCAPARSAGRGGPCPSTTSRAPRLGGQLDRLVEHRHQRVEALDRELLLAQERLVQVALERLDLGQALEQAALLLGVERLAVARPTRSPGAARRAGCGRRCARSRRRSCRSRSPRRWGSASAKRLAGHRHAQHRRRDARHQLRREAHRGRVERRVADAARSRAGRAARPGGRACGAP